MNFLAACLGILVFMYLIVFCNNDNVDRLWQDAQNRVHLIEELDKRTGQVPLCENN